jgi:hypothetical protein
MKKTYEIMFNDYGLCHVIAEDFAEAENKFLKAKYGGDEPRIKSIKVLFESNDPLV